MQHWEITKVIAADRHADLACTATRRRRARAARKARAQSSASS